MQQSSFLAFVCGAALSCQTHEPGNATAPAPARTGPAAPEQTVAPLDAGSLATFRVGAGAAPDEEIPGFDGLAKSAADLCATFLQTAKSEAAEVAKHFSFRQRAPTCFVRPAPASFTPSGSFSDARVLSVQHVSRAEYLLAVKLARGWVITGIGWAVVDSESATPMWATEAPEQFELEGAKMIVYLPGVDVAHNPEPDAASEQRMLRGAVACQDDGTQLRCSKWDPIERRPLGEKLTKGRKAAWAQLPWRNRVDLAWETAGVLSTRSAIPAP